MVTDSDVDAYESDADTDVAAAEEAPNNGVMPPLADANEPILPNIQAQEAGRYPSQSCRSVIGNQPYDEYSPSVQFLQNASCEAQLL